jgi:hypothetical protein
MVQTKMAVKSLEDELYETLAKEIAREMDEGVMSNILVEAGWSRVEFHFKNLSHSNDVHFWLLENCKDDWQKLGSGILFKNIKEAEWFILRWL